MSVLKGQSIELWRMSSDAIREHFGLETPPEPKRVRVINTVDSLRIGGQYIPDLMELQITQDVVGNKLTLEGVILRECLFHALSTDLCDEAKHDVASEFARINLGKKDRDLWINEWKNIPSIRVRANLVYSSFDLMDWMHRLGGFKELDTLIHELECMSRYGKILNFEEYIEYMTQRIQDIVVGLTKTEVKIIDALRKEESASYRQVARKTGLSETWVSTRINQLQKRCVLAEYITIPFSRIGIKPFHVLLSGPSWDDPTRFIKDCPFLYNVQPILNGPWQVIARLTIPDNVDNIRSLDQMASILHRNGIAVDVAETYSVGQTNSFYHYNSNSNHWEIPWGALEGWGHRIQEESLDQLVERIDYPAKTTDSYIDLLDMQILELMQQGIGST
ncbi:MAG: Lrp/AsnC family transcriptional regulator, partial [Candidatus Thorarchaeota archaeon]